MSEIEALEKKLAATADPAQQAIIVKQMRRVRARITLPQTDPDAGLGGVGGGCDVNTGGVGKG
jgi:hypothetical protein